MAKKRRLITRRRLKWVVTVAATLLALWIASSAWFDYGYRSGNHRSLYGISVYSGGVIIMWEEARDPDQWRWMPPGLYVVNHRPVWHWEPSRRYSSHYMLLPNTIATIPLWPAMLVLALVIARLWYTDRRAKPWQCANCRYDLRGLEPDSSESHPTRCPECGTTKKP